MVSSDKTNTPEEVVDLVDEGDQIIGEIAKPIVNSNPDLIHREIAILIHDDEGKILFQQRSRKKVVEPLFWSISVEGHVSVGVLPVDAAHKELKEELGFDTELKFVTKKLIKRPNETYFAYCYKGKYSGQKINIEEEEIEKVIFMNESELENLLRREKMAENSVKMAKSFWREN